MSEKDKGTVMFYPYISKKWIKSGNITKSEITIKLTDKGKLLADAIASDLFIV